MTKDQGPSPRSSLPMRITASWVRVLGSAEYEDWRERRVPYPSSPRPCHPVKARGVKMINLVRRPKLISELQAIGSPGKRQVDPGASVHARLRSVRWTATAGAATSIRVVGNIFQFHSRQEVRHEGSTLQPRSRTRRDAQSRGRRSKSLSQMSSTS